jgi:hypothetical protein
VPLYLMPIGLLIQTLTVDASPEVPIEKSTVDRALRPRVYWRIAAM